MPRLLFTSVCAYITGVHLDSTIFKYFLVGTLGTKLAPYLFTSKTPINQKTKNIKKMFPFKMAAKNRIFVSQKESRDQNLENHFTIGIFQLLLAQSRRTWIHLKTLVEVVLIILILKYQRSKFLKFHCCWKQSSIKFIFGENSRMQDRIN